MPATNHFDEREKLISTTFHNGRYWWAWYDEKRNQWVAPTPLIGGHHVGSKDYVCSAGAISRKRERDLVRLVTARW